MVSLPTMLPRFLVSTVRTNLLLNSLYSALCPEITPVLSSILRPCWVLLDSPDLGLEAVKYGVVGGLLVVKRHPGLDLS